MKLEKEKLVYYGGFPLVVLLLCISSYYLGYHRGANRPFEEEKQLVSRELTEPQELVQDLKAESPDDLTFYRKLKDEKKSEPISVKNPIVAKTTKPKVKTPEKVAQRAKKISALSKDAHWVQVGSFLDIGRAHELVDMLKNEGFPASTRNKATNAGELHRVYVGPYQSKSKADAMIDTLVTRGFTRGFVTR